MTTSCAAVPPVSRAATSAATLSTTFDEHPVAAQVDGDVFESRYIAPSGRPIRAGLIFGPDWYGIYDYPLGEARRFAALGFAVMVVDVYGAGLRPTNDEEAGRMFGQLHGDRRALRARAGVAYRELVSRLPPKARVSAFGFSMGGMTVLELARSGADLSGIVVLSGIVDNPSPADAARIHAPALILHGTADAFAPPEQLVAFSREMDAAKRSYRIELFGGAAHAFTNPKFAGVTEGPLRYSAPDAARADAAVLEFLTALHTAPEAPPRP
jgi:dienelactone hydrolase